MTCDGDLWQLGCRFADEGAKEVVSAELWPLMLRGGEAAAETRGTAQAEHSTRRRVSLF